MNEILFKDKSLKMLRIQILCLFVEIKNLTISNSKVYVF